MNSYITCAFVTGVFYLAQCLCGSLRLRRVSEFSSILRQNNIGRRDRPQFLSIHHSMCSRVASTFWQLWKTLLWMGGYKYLFQVPAFNYRYIPRPGIAGSHVNSVCNSRNCHTVFHSGCNILRSQQQCTRILVSSHLANAFFKKRLYLFLERGEREGEKHQCARGTLIGCLSHVPSWGTGL